MASDHAPAAYVEATTTRDVPVIVTHENQFPFPLRSAPPSSACRARATAGVIVSRSACSHQLLACQR
jgi:hypothetical protein